MLRRLSPRSERRARSPRQGLTPGSFDTVSAVDRGLSIAERLQHALAGDKRAWDALVADYTGLLWWIARSHRLDDPTAADVVQTVWLQLIRHGAAIRDPERLPAWLATVARNESRRRIEAARRQVPTDAVGEALGASEAGPDEYIIDKEDRAAALSAFHELGARCQRLLSLLCEEPPRGYEEVAAILDMPVGSIGPTRGRCLAELRTIIGRMGHL